MNFSQPRKDKIPFAEVRASSAFMSEAQKLLVREISNRSSGMISGGNHQIFYHGQDWTYQREDREGFTTQTGHLQLHTQEVTVSVDLTLFQKIRATFRASSSNKAITTFIKSVLGSGKSKPF